MHFPVWPPDAFGFCAKLLEQSGWYAEFTPRPTRFIKEEGQTVGSILKENLGLRAFDYSVNVEENDTDRFGILGTDFVELRIAGAIWAMGGVFSINKEYDLFGQLTNDYHPAIKDGWKDITFDDNHRSLRSLPEDLPYDRIYDEVKQLLRLNYPRTKNVDWEKQVDNIIEVYARHEDSPIRQISSGDKFFIPTPATGKCSKRILNKSLTETPVYERQMGDNVCALFSDLISRPFIHPSTKILLGYKEISSAKHGAINDAWTQSQHIKGLLLSAWATDYLQARWLKILSCTETLSKRNEPPPASTLPLWVRPAFRLMIAADEASLGLGFSRREATRGKRGDTHVQRLNAHNMKVRRRAGIKEKTDNNGVVTQISRFRPRIVQNAVQENIAAVFPKSRTPSVGCTITSFGLNLCLIPSKGQLQTKYLNCGIGDFPDRVPTPLNLLLIPYPYRLPTRAFSPVDADRDEHGWSNFEVCQQEWLGTDFLAKLVQGRETEKYSLQRERLNDIFSISTFVKMILNETSMRIDGIILPELALDDRNFSILKEYLLEKTSVRLLISGVSDGYRRILHLQEGSDTKQQTSWEPVDGRRQGIRQGNLVHTVFRPHAENRKKWDLQYIRAKHHRWKLTSRQLERYGLSGKLSPDLSWWEKLDIFPRELGLFEFAPGSLASALICEDLARIEPCQVALRSIGPNLIFSILLDGPQLNHRWSNQYAGVLADDPGSSVLTLTSLGMIKREENASNSNKDFTDAPHAISLWRDPTTSAQSLMLPANHQALVITIAPEYTEESSQDGRGDGKNAAIWKLQGFTPIDIYANSKEGKYFLDGFTESEWDLDRNLAQLSSEELDDTFKKMNGFVDFLEREIARKQMSAS